MTKQVLNPEIKEAVDLLITKDLDMTNILGQGGLLKELTKAILERALSAEMDEHLGYNRYERSENGNTRNGSYSKNLMTENGPLDLEVPRDRDGEFEPIIVPKKQTRIKGLDDKILSLYAKGMSLSDIQLQIQELYGAEISESLISKITDNVMEEVKLWQAYNGPQKLDNKNDKMRYNISSKKGARNDQEGKTI